MKDIKLEKNHENSLLKRQTEYRSKVIFFVPVLKSFKISRLS